MSLLEVSACVQQKRVVHILYNLERGGIQTWLYDLLCCMNRDIYHIDFIVFMDVESPFVEKIEALGSNVFVCGGHRNLGLFAFNLYAILKQNGPYDVVHCHTGYHAGCELFVAMLAGVRRRICHMHSGVGDMGVGLVRKCYERLMLSLIKHVATDCWAVSKSAGQGFYGESWSGRVVPAAVDFSRFAKIIDCDKVCVELGVPAGAYVVGHVGRFVTAKNHKFLVLMFAQICKKLENVYLVMVGDGELLPIVQQQVSELGVQDRVIFTGVCDDVPAIMGCFDVLVLPSLYEGLGLVVLEACAVGVPCVVSDMVPDDVCVVVELIRRLKLDSDLSEWVSVVVNILENRNKYDRGEICDIVSASKYQVKELLY